MRAFGAMPGFLECFAAQKKVSGLAFFSGIFEDRGHGHKIDKFGRNRSKKRFLGHAGRAFKKSSSKLAIFSGIFNKYS